MISYELLTLLVLIGLVVIATPFLFLLAYTAGRSRVSNRRRH